MVSKKPGFLFVFQCHKISEISPRRCFDIEGPRARLQHAALHADSSEATSEPSNFQVVA